MCGDILWKPSRERQRQKAAKERVVVHGNRVPRTYCCTTVCPDTAEMLCLRTPRKPCREEGGLREGTYLRPYLQRLLLVMYHAWFCFMYHVPTPFPGLHVNICCVCEGPEASGEEGDLQGGAHLPGVHLLPPQDERGGEGPPSLRGQS